MDSFLDQVTSDLWDKYGSFENLTLILPGKRAGAFLKNGIPKITNKTVFTPTIYSIESFIELIADLRLASQTQQLFELYEAYLQLEIKNQDSFASFSRWSKSILQDFNEIDRYLVTAKDLFDSLSFIKEIEFWSPQAGSTKLVEDYIEFWKELPELYEHFNGNLIKKGLGHQGLIYREANNKLNSFLNAHKNTNYVFVGFNALNKAEESLIQSLLKTGRADIYWDLDRSFLEDKIHDAGYFIRQHLKNWKYFQTNKPKGLSEHFQSKKNIKIIGVPKNIAQAKLIGSIVKEINESSPKQLTKTAIVLGDEGLLNPLLNSLPIPPEKVNITMGYPLKKTSLTGLFHLLFDLYIQLNNKGWYYKNLLSFLSHPAIQEILAVASNNKAQDLQKKIKTRNWIYIHPSEISLLTDNALSPLGNVFSAENKTPDNFLKMILRIIQVLKENYQKKENNLDLEYLFKYHSIFEELEALVKSYPYIKDLKSLQSLFNDLESSESLDFLGEPLEGLQIMGMLESRNLDFETVIISSVNEGILPSGKTNISYIPLDLKRRFGLPTYKEKDAVYTYHFYRLLQRAKNIYLIYNTEVDTLKGGEKSRFISQLSMDEFHGELVSKELRMPQIQSSLRPQLTITKTNEVIGKIEECFTKGLSPSSLSNYIKNPIAFYKEKILNIKESPQMEETIAHNTLGTVIHKVLENVYAPFTDQYLDAKILSLKLKDVKVLVNSELQTVFKDDDIHRGKNLIASRIIVKYISRFIESEIEDLGHNSIKLLSLEEHLSLNLNIQGIGVPVKLKGIIDRVDERNGIRRILDYKTGKVKTTEVEITSWTDIGFKVERAKAFQLLCYSLMYMNKNPDLTSLQAGIIPIKTRKTQPFLFCQKPNTRSNDKNRTITNETLDAFRTQLEEVIKEIINPLIPFKNIEE
ncbi:MAG: PD-(D/E)XK nuclease family protein [Eudoraea sp.]